MTEAQMKKDIEQLKRDECSSDNHHDQHEQIEKDEAAIKRDKEYMEKEEHMAADLEKKVEYFKKKGDYKDAKIYYEKYEAVEKKEAETKHQMEADIEKLKRDEHAEEHHHSEHHHGNHEQVEKDEAA